MQSWFRAAHTARYLTDMTRAELSQIKAELCSLAVFRSVLSDGVVSALKEYISSLNDESLDARISRYSEFVAKLYSENGGNLSAHIENVVYNSENVYVRAIGAGEKPSGVIAESVAREIDILSRIAALTPQELCEPLRWDGSLPQFSSRRLNLAEMYDHRVKNISKYGYGKYAASRMFYIENSEIVPVRNPDKIQMSELVDYELQRNRIMANTKALLEGKPAANILLTGDAGTGKSSTVKAVVNELYSQGLRIIEVRKDQLAVIPKILDDLALNPLKFILFIDDLSFLSDDDDFNSLKAVLEGSVSGRSQNVVVYATSNRRHIVKERFEDREGDEVHRNDAMQEIISLSDRFGLHISFQKPDKKTYLDIVGRLAARFGVDMPADELELLAERFALERGGRSARLARQFIDGILAQN